MPWLLALLLAAGSVHRAKAERAEALGHMSVAAREYEAAYREDREPELLYRLGIVLRKLKQYAKAREALRAYLRAAPEGGLREEVQRQLVKLEVLIEAQTEDYADEDAAPRRERRSPLRSGEVNGVHQAPPASQPAPVGEQRSPALSEQVNGVHQAPPPASQPAPVGEQRSPALSEQVNGVHQVPPPAPAAALPAPAGEQRSPALLEQVNGVHQAPPPALRRRAAPWLAAGAAASIAAGAYLWWDGNRLSNALDARYAQGDLAPADQPLYGRAHGASIAGRALVIGGGLLCIGAVALWW